LPVAEIAIVAGGCAVVFALVAGPLGAAPALLGGIAAVLAGTAEVSWREHISGYRSHAVLLALLPVAAFHTAVVVGVGALTPFPRVANAALLAIDVGLWFFLFRYLRARYVEARRLAIATAA
jgi:hypothetical protein